MKRIKIIIGLEIIILAYMYFTVTIVKEKPEPIVLGMGGEIEMKGKPKPVVKPVVRQDNSGTYRLTHYGPDCSGCSGQTAAGYNVSNTIYYNDSTYGTVRIIAMSRNVPLYSIVKIYGYKGGDITAIVLDRGVGNGVIDLLVESESRSSQLGTQSVRMEILRNGR